MVLAELVEDERRPPGGVRVRGPGSSAPSGASQAKRVTLSSSSSTPSRRTRAAVGARPRPPSRAPPSGRSELGDLADGVGGAADRPHLGAGQLLAEEARALRDRPADGRSRPRSRSSGDLRRARSAPGGSGGRTRRRCGRASVSKASASRVGRTVPSIEFSKGTKPRSASPASTARDRLVDRRPRVALEGAPAGGEPQGLVGEGPGRAEVGDLHRGPAGVIRVRAAPAPSPRAPRARARAASVPLDDRLRVDARLLALQDRRDRRRRCRGRRAARRCSTAARFPR